MDILELRLKTNALQAMHDFYVGSLGFAVLEEHDDALVLDAGGTRLIFEADSGKAFVYHFAFNIPHNQLVDAKIWLAQHTPLLTYNGENVIEHSAWEAEAVYFRDPGGNIGEVIARRRIANSSAIPFSAQSIQGVSEIGLAVEDVQATVAALQADLKLPAFGTPSETFAAVGDDHGLLIVVAKHRVWFPTEDVKAKKRPVTLTIRGDAMRTYTLPGTDYVIHVSDV